MSGIFQRFAKRKSYPVDIDGEVAYICEPTIGQIDRVQALGGAKSTGLAIGFCMVHQGGAHVFSALPDESDEAFADRVLSEANDCTVSVVRQISDAILKLIKPVDQDALAKN